GHSVRAGSATFFASLGVSESIIQAMGRWSSDAWKIYIRDHSTVRAELQLASLRAAEITPTLLFSPSFIFFHLRLPHTHYL
ncbi:hypothetical protein F5878DRAFT_548726, partial [Lentinula raphanica]